MSKTKRREQAARRAQASRSITPMISALFRDPAARVRMGHAADCTDMRPHFCPPSFGDVGFFMCNVPADIRNHSRGI